VQYIYRRKKQVMSRGKKSSQRRRKKRAPISKVLTPAAINGMMSRLMKSIRKMFPDCFIVVGLRPATPEEKEKMGLDRIPCWYSYGDTVLAGGLADWASKDIVKKYTKPVEPPAEGDVQSSENPPEGVLVPKFGQEGDKSHAPDCPYRLKGECNCREDEPAPSSEPEEAPDAYDGPAFPLVASALEELNSEPAGEPDKPE
jgi:hypothetical protein